jgi:hypothetical protein
MTNPYHHLEFVIGNGDDFWCFDYASTTDGKIRLHAVVNCETSHFIEDAETPVEVPPSEAVSVAQGMVDAAISWMANGWDCIDGVIEHDTEGWNQDPQYFVRCVQAYVSGEPKPVERIVEKDRLDTGPGNWCGDYGDVS